MATELSRLTKLAAVLGRAPETGALLDSYPRSRPTLPPEYEAAHEKMYLDSRAGTGAVQRLAQTVEGWMHHRVARLSSTPGPVLELGAGTLNHLRYEPSTAPYDVVEPLEVAYQDSPDEDRVRHFYEDVRAVPDDAEYQRIFSIAVLEHLVELPVCLARAGLLLGPGGVFQAGIPTEGGLMWGASWRATTGLSWRLRTGLDYGRYMRWEHVNMAVEILALARWFFDDVQTARFPTPGHHLSLFCYFEARRPRLERCRAYLSR